jgi:hypothetical protein
MSKVTIEGSVTPSAFLARGERRTVERTDFIDTLIRKRYVVEIPDTPLPVGDNAPADPDVPARNASKLAWVEFMQAQGYEVSEAATRSDLIEQWEADERG